MKNPPWSRDEHIITLSFYLKHTPNIPGKKSEEIRELSRILNLLQKYIGGDIPDGFRNENGVYMKLMNFRRLDPAYKGVGLVNGNKDEEVVWNLYASTPEKLYDLSQRILSFTNSVLLQKKLPDLNDDEIESNEGQLLSRIHRYYERDANLTKKKKERFFSQNNALYCECCGFNFAEIYGEHGKGFIECHHTKPLSELKAESITKISELVLLCANCHRMIHRHKPWLSIEELKEKIMIKNNK
ncbi:MULTISPECIES: HNH endonuclease [unclassified Serratia (in: enterobacteria)]|uniref:HNH endonuclease n=1 Tax=unclassified Serratia (in: enterobacteria) TaxID=2647522 RepID=UPI00050430A4|nr:MULTISPECIES: HNH endonuclease [unclassified Serratia (in: enterobacteria)]KFK96455.1 hypothetical protein JV45_05145 [Serratia sp. Ag2]KFK99930.1 hypothetical protein IV04_05025 [Serratia sp. Ag1]